MTNQDRRHIQRASLRTAAKVWVEFGDKPIEGKCCDISRAGILLDLPQAIEQGMAVNLALLDPLSLNPLMSARAQVVRCERSAQGRYTVGLTLLETLE
jgi:hypothetical protein